MKPEPLVPFLHRLADRVEAEGDLTGAECLRGLAHDHPRMQADVGRDDRGTGPACPSACAGNRVAVEHLRLSRRPRRRRIMITNRETSWMCVFCGYAMDATTGLENPLTTRSATAMGAIFQSA